MNMIQFLKERKLTILFHFLSLIIISFILYLFNENGSLIVVINLIFLFFFLISLGFEFYKIENFYNELKNVFQNLEEKSYITEIVKPPLFYSGQVFYEILKDATKVMNDRILSLKNSQNAYNDYIELWVHEIKTPITALRLILNNHRTPENILTQDEVSKIEGYVEQALYYARSNTLNQDYKIETFALDKVVNLAVKSLSLGIIRANGSIHMENLDLKVTSDSKWIVFILKQLIDNAIKYRSNSLKISFVAKKLKNGTVILISDNGIGITAADIERIFNRGFTGTNGRSYVKSTGMGLYLCKTLTQKLGLLINAESQEEIGTTVKIFFPDKLKIFH